MNVEREQARPPIHASAVVAGNRANKSVLPHNWLRTLPGPWQFQRRWWKQLSSGGYINTRQGNREYTYKWQGTAHDGLDAPTPQACSETCHSTACPCTCSDAWDFAVAHGRQSPVSVLLCGRAMLVWDVTLSETKHVCHRLLANHGSGLSWVRAATSWYSYTSNGTAQRLHFTQKLAKAKRSG